MEETPWLRDVQFALLLAFQPTPMTPESELKISALTPVGVAVSFFCIGITRDLLARETGIEGGWEPKPMVSMTRRGENAGLVHVRNDLTLVSS